MCGSGYWHHTHGHLQPQKGRSRPPFRYRSQAEIWEWHEEPFSICCSTEEVVPGSSAGCRCEDHTTLSAKGSGPADTSCHQVIVTYGGDEEEKDCVSYEICFLD